MHMYTTHIPLSSATDASTPVLPPRVNPTTKSQVPTGLGDLHTRLFKAIQAHQPWNRCSVRLMVHKELKQHSNTWPGQELDTSAPWMGRGTEKIPLSNSQHERAQRPLKELTSSHDILMGPTNGPSGCPSSLRWELDKTMLVPLESLAKPLLQAAHVQQPQCCFCSGISICGDRCPSS